MRRVAKRIRGFIGEEDSILGAKASPAWRMRKEQEIAVESEHLSEVGLRRRRGKEKKERMQEGERKKRLDLKPHSR